MTWQGIYTTLVIGADETRVHEGGGEAFTLMRYTGGDGRAFVSPTLINFGSLSSISEAGEAANYVLTFDVGVYWDGVVVENHGVMSATSAHGEARTIHSSSWSPSILNSGTISALAPEEQSFGIFTFSIHQPFGPFFKPFWIHNLAGGEIVSEGAKAFGVLSMIANIINDGTIHAIGHQVSAVGFRTTGGYIENNGLILAEADPGLPTWGVVIAEMSRNPQRDTTLINRGTIEAEIAIDELHDGGAATTVLNQGIIDGAIILYNGDDYVENRGSIDGDVTLGDGNDVYDGQGGVLSGSVSGAAGDDTIHMGDHGGTAMGGDGVDTAMADYGDQNSAVICTVVDGVLLLSIDGATQLTLSGFERFDIAAGAGYDEITTGATDDVVRLGRGGGIADAGAGDDRITLDFSDQTAVVSYVHNTVEAVATVGGDAAAVLRNAEHVEITGGSAADHLIGGGGDDVFVGGAGADELDGGAGFDIAGYAGSDEAVSVQLGGAASGGDAAGDSLANFEGLIGSSQDDALYGDSGDNFLDGGSGSDLLVGGAGNDTYIVDSSGDVLVEVANGGVDRVFAWASCTLADDVDNLELMGTADIDGVGNDLANIILGNAGDNLLTGNGGADQIDGGEGYDTLSYATSPGAVSVVFGAAVASGADAQGDTFNWIEHIIGSNFNDTFTGAHLQDSFEGGAGADVIDGKAHYDTASYAHSSSAVNINLGTNTHSGGDATGDSLIEIEGVIGSAFNDVLIGSSTSNGLFGGAGDDFLAGHNGSDHFDGGAGVDVVSYESATAGVTIDLGRGLAARGIFHDTLVDVENVLGSGHNDLIAGDAGANTLSGLAGDDQLQGEGGDDDLLGGAGADTLKGGDGADWLDGGAGLDHMSGGAGDDTYFVDDSGDVTSETAPGDGNDTIVSSVARTLVANLENLTLTGLAAINGTGNALNNIINGNSASNVLTGNAGNDTLNGEGGADTLRGGDGDDTLDGGTGADSMTGNAGDDAYIVDNNGDTVSEGSSTGGTDHVFASVTFNISPGGFIENLTLTGASAINGTGNNQNNIVTGNGAVNTLAGNAGADDLFGGGANDTLYGGDGNDDLDGGTGADRMVGNFGDDTYVVDNAGDTVAEGNVAGGVDHVFASVNFSLGPTGFAENLTLTGSANLEGRGNGYDNVITGNSGNNFLIGNAGVDQLNGAGGSDTLHGGDGNDTLDGGIGADSMVGNNGDDTYIVDNSGDTVSEGSSGGGANDHVFASVTFALGPTGYVEHLTLTGLAAINGTGNGFNNTLTGNDAANTLNGNSGDDVIDGGLGGDTLIGGVGADQFVFSTVLGAGNVDAITGYNVAADTMVLDVAVFTALSPGGLGASAFVIGAVAGDSDDRVIYDSGTGALYYDEDGSGAAAQVQFAALNAGLALTHDDFIVGGG